MKITNIILIFVLSVTSAFAQSQQCGTDALVMGMPRQERMMPPPEVDLDTAEVIVIPVVFHVVHLGELIGEGTNISDEQIQSAVVALNEDFRKMEGTNGDGLGVDTKIEFCLASRTPDNQPTTGIVRHDGSNIVFNYDFGGQTSTSTYLEHGVSDGSIWDVGTLGVPITWLKQTLGCWDTEEYLNIWVVSEINNNNGGNGIQGFSYVGYNPTFCANGIVQLYNVTGTIGTLKSTHNMNRTTTHEVGHALGLFHTFGFGLDNTPCEETNCETQGDLVCDTPPTSANTGCSIAFSECPDAQLENYMDYTSQTCRNTFTQGQAERMRDEIWNSWNGFTQSLGCLPVVDLDGGISAMSIGNPNCETTFDVSVTIANYGVQDLTNPTITFSFGSNIQNFDLELTLVAGQTYTQSFELTSLSSATIDANITFQEDEDYLANNTESAEYIYEQGNRLRVEISPDVWSNEIDWELLDESGEVIAYGGNYPISSQDSTFVEEVCLFGACYTFVMTDSAGDGMCQWDFNGDGICDSSSDAFVKIYLNNEIIYDLSSLEEIDFGSMLTFEFCDQIVDCQGDVDGDNRVGVNDLLAVLANIGCISTSEPCEGDLDGNGTTDNTDLQAVLGNYGNFCSAIALSEIVNEKEPILMPKALDYEAPIGLYDIMGRKVSNDKSVLRRGIYIEVYVDDAGNVATRKIFLQ